MVDDKNGRQTQIRRRHLTVSPISDRDIPSKRAERNSGPLRHPAENKDFWALQRTHQFPLKQRARGFYRLIVVDRRSPVPTIDVGRN